MSGYSKRMMEIAAAWLRTNPIPGDAVHLPRSIDQFATTVVKDVQQTKDLIAKAREQGQLDVVQELEGVLSTFEGILADPKLGESVADLHNLVNRSYRLEQSKLDRASNQAADPHSADPLWYANEVPWLLPWAREGYNVFDLSPDFVAAMLLTDPSEIDLPALKLPFSGMLFMIPDGFAIGAEGLSYTKIHVAATDDSRSRGEEDTKEKRPAILIYASDGMHLLSTVVARADLSWSTLEELPDDVELDADKEARKTIQRVVLGAIAYATAVDRAITDRFPAAKKKKVRDQPSIAHWTIGRTIQIDPELVRVARSGSREIAFRIKSRFIVRGHYRNQAHGPARSLRSSRWIAPHCRGPEEGARLVHTYKPEPGSKP